MMMAPYEPDDELQRLLAIVADDRLSEEQERRLDQILGADPQARAYSLRFISMLTSLQWK
jgi:hypothetical protein